MAIFTSADRQRLQSIVRYLSNGGAGGRLDQSSADELAKIFGGYCNFRCACGNFQQQLKHSPALTLLRVLICADEGIVIPGAAVVEPIAALSASSLLCDYGILAGTTVTNTGPTVITGDLGLSPGSSVTGFPPGVVTGETHIADSEAAQAQIELTAAYLEAESRTTPTPTVVGPQVGSQTLTPGIYKSLSNLEVTSGDLILDAQGNPNGIFLFQAATMLVVTRNIILIGGAQARNIIWQVGSSATLGTGAIFQGSILALTSITAFTGASVAGRLLARNGAVTLDTNAVVVQPC